MIVFDLDGTLRDGSCAEQYIPGDPTNTVNWLKWQYCVNNEGSIIKKTVELLTFFNNTANNESVILTSSQFGTKQWLIDKCDLLFHGEIIERDKHDHRSPFNYKKGFIDEHKTEITLWVDDSKRVCDYVESLGINVVRVKG